jgi:hypothetical protein
VITVTGAFLAEHAGAIEAKLCVWGGVLDTLQVDRDKVASATLVIIVERPTEDDRLGSHEERFTLDIRRPDSTTDRRILRFPPQSVRPKNGFVWFEIDFLAADKGTYTFSVHAGAEPGEEDSILSALEGELESTPPPAASYSVEVRHDRLFFDDGPENGFGRLV